MKKIFTLFAALAMVMSMSAKPYLRGTFNGWGTGNEFQNGECTINLTANTDYEFKVDNNGDWGTSFGGAAITSTYCTNVNCSGSGNATIKTTFKGSYTFKWDATNKKISVVYPTEEVVKPKKDITVKAKMPATWTNTITAWVWTDEDPNGKAVTPEKDGDWYVITQNTAVSYIIFRNGTDWNGDVNQTADMNFEDNACIQLSQSGNMKATYTNVDCEGSETPDPTPDPNPEPSVISYVLMGVAGDWTTGIALTRNEANTEFEEYMLLNQEITATDSVKVVTITDGVQTAWCNVVDSFSTVTYVLAGEFQNIVLAPGVYDFYFKVADAVIYIGATLVEPTYDPMDLTVTNLVMVDDPVFALTGSATIQNPDDLTLSLVVDVTAPNEDGTYNLTNASELKLGSSLMTFISGMALIDMMSNTATAQVKVQFEGMYFQLTINMSAKATATDVVVENATAVVEERELGFGNEVYYVLKMTSTWSNGETTYPVSLETAEFDPSQKSQEVDANVTIGGMGDDDPWLGSADGKVTITIVDTLATVVGLLENPYAFPAPIAFNLTISGILPKTIYYELNGGELPTVAVPTNAELWGTDTADVNGFMNYYNHYYNLKRATQTIENVATFAPAKMQQIMTDETSEYKWLGDYVQSVATAAGVPLSTDMAAANESGWRWSVWAFFNACAGKNGSAGIDFTEAGKPEVWGAAYQAAKGIVLPTEPVAEAYTLPTPTKEGSVFQGWYDNAEGQGEAMTVIPAGWYGTLYAIWTVEGGATTGLDNVPVVMDVVKVIKNGQLVIIRNGVEYNANGAILK